MKRDGGSESVFLCLHLKWWDCYTRFRCFFQTTFLPLSSFNLIIRLSAKFIFQSGYETSTMMIILLSFLQHTMTISQTIASRSVVCNSAKCCCCVKLEIGSSKHVFSSVCVILDLSMSQKTILLVSSISMWEILCVKKYRTTPDITKKKTKPQDCNSIQVPFPVILWPEFCFLRNQ